MIRRPYSNHMLGTPAIAIWAENSKTVTFDPRYILRTGNSL